MDDCIFCKIVKGDIPSIKIYEDEHVNRTGTAIAAAIENDKD